VHITILSRYCHPVHPYGGLERMIYHHCRELEARGVKVTLYTEPPFEAEVEDAGVFSFLLHPGASGPAPLVTVPCPGVLASKTDSRTAAEL
jgi:hypothetical protein